MLESLTWINGLLDQLFALGPVPVYGAIFLACFVENIFPPFPGDTFIVGGGALVASGRLDLFSTVLAIIVGGMSSTMLLYYFGMKFGREYFIRKNYALFSADDVVKVESKLSRWGGGIFVASRFIVGFRSALSASAGIARYPVGRMFIYSFLSYLAFTAVLMYFSISLVESFAVISEYFRIYQWLFWPIASVIVIVYVYRRLRASRAKRKKGSEGTV